jgi:hypothetical protein
MEKSQEDVGQLKIYGSGWFHETLLVWVIYRAAFKVGCDLLRRQGPRLKPDTGRNKHYARLLSPNLFA